MVTRKSKKTTSRSRVSGARTAIAGRQSIKKIRHDALALLRSLRRPEERHLRQSNTIIRKLIIDTDVSDADLGEKVLFLLSCALSVRQLPGYATLDPDHARDITNLVTTVENYVDDTSQKRPLNFLMLASPGAGKSHFIK